MRYLYISIVFTLFCLFAVRSYGQFNAGFDYNNHIETLSMEQGLSNESVTSIQQDKSGFLWFGTSAGLNRYDGYQFETFLYEIDDPGSLRHSYVRDLLVDNSGKLWVATWGREVNIFNPEKQEFTSLSEEFDTGSIDIHNHINCIHQSKDGSFWIGTLSGLVYFNPDTKTFEKYLTVDSGTSSISDEWIIEILESSDGSMMFLGADGRLNVFNQENKSFQRFEIRKDSEKKDLITITKLFEDSYQNLLVGTNKGLFSFIRHKGEFVNILKDDSAINALSNNPIIDIFEYNEDLIWVSSLGRGIFELERLVEDKKQFKRSERPNILPENWVQKIFRDVQGNIWIGTRFEGLKVIYNAQKQFYQIELKNSVALAITVDNEDNLWIGTANGLLQYSKETKTKKRYTINSDLLSNTVRSLFVDDKRLFIGTESGLYVMNLETKDIKSWREGNNILNAPLVTITIDDEGNLWMGSDQQGLVCIDKQSGEVSNYIASSEGKIIGKLIGIDNVTSLCFESKDKLWVGIYGGGINLFDIRKREFIKRYLHDPDNKNSLIDNNVLDLFKDKKGNIWIATLDGGLSHFDPRTGIFKPYLKKDGLPSNSVNGIIDDNDDNLWISTHNGLVKFDIESGKIKYFDTSDGLLNIKFEPRSAWKDSKGIIYLGSKDGVVYFDTKQVHENEDEPKLLFTNFKIHNKTIDFNDKNAPLQKHISFSNSLVLKHNQTAISLEFVALNFISSAKNRYMFRMEGLEKEWREVGTQRVANYFNIPPGTYTFMVRASNNDGVWTEPPLALKIKVLPHPLKSNLAKSAYIILFLVLNVIIIQMIKRYIEQKHLVEVAQIERDKEKQLTHFKLQFFTNISHELRSHLSLIVSPVNKLLRKKNQSNENRELLDRIDLNVVRLLKLTDEIIDFRKVEQGRTDLDIQKADIVLFIRKIYKLFKPIAEEYKISCEFQAGQPEIIWCFDEEKLTKIIFNLLSNAIKYTPDAGQIKLTVNPVDEGKLRIGIEDNGLGIEEEHLPHIFNRFFNPGKDQQVHASHDSAGIGLALVKQLIDLHKGQIFVESQTGKGSHFYFDLPKLECPDVETISVITPIFPEKHEKLGKILQIERNNIQYGIAITNELKSEEIPAVMIVDDNKEICLALNDLLKDKYRTYVAGNGKQAIEIAGKEYIDVVLSDVMMPVMDGIELCNCLKSNIETSHIPVVLLTAKTGIDNELAGLRIGADAYITKPFNDEKVLLTIGNILETRKKNQLFLKGEYPEKESEPIINPLDKKLIDKVYHLIKENISDSDFSVDELGREAGLSRMHLFRKMKVLTGYSPSDLIKKIRLEKSKELLQQGELTISNIAYDNGFSTPGNFSTAFKKFFGVTPAHYRAKYFGSNSQKE